MDSLTITKQQKKRETLLLIILGLTLAIIWLVSKFVLGINFAVMEHGSYAAFGYHEIRGERVWTLSFDSFSGAISADGELPENGKRRLLIHSRAENSELELTVKTGDEMNSYILDGNAQDLTIPGTERRFTMTISGTEVLSGYFNAVWE